MPNWPSAGTVKEVPTERNLRILRKRGGELERELNLLKKEGLPPSGKAGGVLKGEYPNPEFAKEPAYKAEIENETTARKEVDLILKGEIESEEAAREAADKAEKEAREAADAAEKSAREAADAERVVGPGTATDNTFAVFDGATGKKIKMPSATVSAAERKIAKVLTPTEALDAANKEYVDTAAAAAAAGLSIKQPVTFASTANITGFTEVSALILEKTAPLTIDGTSSFAIGTRLLLKNQTNEKRNGIWEVTKSATFGGEGAFGGEGTFGSGSVIQLTRTKDADTTEEVKQGMYVSVTKGATNAGTAWTLSTEDPIVIGTSSLAFSPYTAVPGGSAGGDLEGTFPNPTLRPALRAQIACRLATQAALAAYTRTENVITANANGALANIDGTAAAAGDYVLLKNGAAGADNGIYRVVSLGSAGSKWSMERASEMNLSAEYIPGMLITIAEGTKNLDRVYQLTTNNPITLNVTELSFALVQPENWGIVEALPTSGALRNDTCAYVADKTNGVLWELIYDEEGEFPWKKVGGPPILAEVLTSQTTTSTSYTNLTTEGPSATTPLKGDYIIRHGAGIGAGAAGLGGFLMSYAVGGAAASDTDAIQATQKESLFLGSVSRERRKTGIAASTAIVAKYRVTTGTGLFMNRWLSIDPIRVG